MNGKGSIRVTKTKVLQVRSEDAMDNWVSPLSGERFRKGSMEEEEEGEDEDEDEDEDEGEQRCATPFNSVKLCG